MSRAFMPWCISQIATTTAAPTMIMNAGFQNTSDTMIATPRPTPEAIATGRLRPARPGSFVAGGSGCAGIAEVSVIGSDLDELGFLVLEHLVDLVGVLLGRARRASSPRR